MLVPDAVSELIEAIVTAVRVGNDQHIRTLMRDLARIAGIQVSRCSLAACMTGYGKTAPVAGPEPASRRHLNRHRAAIR